MFLRIEEPRPFFLAGLNMPMTFARHDPAQLWRAFMPRLKEVTNREGAELYSAEVYEDTSFFHEFDPLKPFVKWAAARVSSPEAPQGMELLKVSGKFAVFMHKGTQREAERTYTHIFREWLPLSGFCLAHGPHLAIMGETYRKDEPDSQEEIWIPVSS